MTAIAVFGMSHASSLSPAAVGAWLRLPVATWLSLPHSAHISAAVGVAAPAGGNVAGTGVMLLLLLCGASGVAASCMNLRARSALEMRSGSMTLETVSV